MRPHLLLLLLFMIMSISLLIHSKGIYALSTILKSVGNIVPRCRASSYRRQLSSSKISDTAGIIDADRAHMFLALRHAQSALRLKEVPVGAVIVGRVS
jgi:hypothetical protein